MNQARVCNTNCGLQKIRKVGRALAESKGTSIVEFAVLTPILLLIVMGIVDLGRAVYYKNSLENAAREGARAGIVMNINGTLRDDGNLPLEPVTVYESIQPYQGTNTIVGRAARHLAGLDLNRTKVEVSANSGILGGGSFPLKVRVEYLYTPASSILGVPDINLVAESTMLIE